MDTMKMYLFLALSVVLVAGVTAENTGDDTENAEVDPEKIDYAKGSVCQYCEYCEFCPLCEEDCPCPTTSTKPACHMCKYCDYCRFCKLCDMICTPGGVLDRVSGSLVSMLPIINHDLVNEEIDGVQDEIDKKRVEL